MTVFGATQSVQDRAAAEYARIDANPRLTAEAKQQDKIRVWADAGRELQSRMASEDAARSARKADLERSLFGLPAAANAMDAIAHRDAVQRAASFDVTDERALDQATRTFRAATASGDVQLAKALVAQAIENKWPTLVDEYAQQAPAAAAQLEELSALSRTGGRDMIDRALTYFNPAPPNMPSWMTPERMQLEADGRELDRT